MEQMCPVCSKRIIANFGESGETSTEAQGPDDGLEMGVEAETQHNRSLSNPVKPSAEEVDKHEATHIDYRSWCRACVMGRGVGLQHYSVNRKSTIPRIGLDYFYLTHGASQEPEGEHNVDIEKLEEMRADGAAVKCLIIKCLETRNVFAYIVPRKGVDEEAFVVSLVVRAIQWLGHVRLILKK